MEKTEARPKVEKMKIKRLTLRACDIPLKIAYRQSTNKRTRSRGIIIEVTTENGKTGYGECLPREYVTGETRKTVIETVETLAEKLLRTQFKNIPEIKSWLDLNTGKLSPKDRYRSCSRCALELSLLDAFGKDVGMSVGKMLGIKQVRPIQYSGVVAGRNQATNDQIIDFLEQLYITQIKVKVGWDLSADLKLINTIKSRLGSGVDLRVDVNGVWSLDEAVENIAVLTEAGIKNFEQPLHQKARDNYLILMDQIPSSVSIWVDESLCSPIDAEWFIQNKAAHGFNLKISKNGGIFNCIEISSKARKKGLKCQLGSQVGETSLLTAAGYLLAIKEKDLVFHEGAFGSYLIQSDITKNEYIFGKEGKLYIPGILDTPGLGIKTNQQMIEKLKPLKIIS